MGAGRTRGGQNLTTAQWIDRAQTVHGDKFDYSLVEYVDFKTKVAIICIEHGVFEQIPINHVSAGQGCRACAGLASPSTSEWIERARLVHGGRFGYEHVRYVNGRSKVTIRCPEHGYFDQTPKNHVVNGQGCPRCIGRGLSTTEWIEKARAVHGDKYDYSAVEYTTTTKPVVIVCGEHGPFEQTPSVHVKDRCGCPKCAGQGLSNEEWIDRARSIHGDDYDYSRFVYVRQDVKCEIICFQHGSFRQTILNHIYNGSGCPLCAGSKGEKLVSRVLDGLGVDHQPQWSHPTCRDRAPLLFDFYMPPLRALIEFDGIQHFEPVKWFDAVTDEQADAQFLVTQRRDRIKNDWAAVNGYPLLRVSELKDVEAEVTDFVEMLRQRGLEVKDAEDGEL